MGAKTQEPLPPMVLAFNCRGVGALQTQLGLEGQQGTEEFYGYAAKIAYIAIGGSLDAEKQWWVHPSNEDSLKELVFDVMEGEYSPKEMLGWIETPAFVKHIRRDINAAIRRGLGLKPGVGFDRRLHEAVKLVVISSDFYPEESPYVERVFDGYFRNAKYWRWANEAFSSSDALRPLWRDAKITELKKKPSLAEVLDWSVTQLPLEETGCLNFAQLGVETVEQLVQKTAPDLHTVMSVEQTDEVRRTLDRFGLWLGMTEQNIEAWKLGLPRGTQLTTPADIRADTRRQRSSG